METVAEPRSDRLDDVAGPRTQLGSMEGTLPWARDPAFNKLLCWPADRHA